jgi:acetoin utilization protein AcuB
MPDAANSPLVRDFMTPNPTTLTPDQPLLQAVLTMRSLSIRHLPILQDGKLVGLITDRDVARVSPSILSAVSQDEYNQVFEQTMIQRVMAKRPVSVAPDQPLADAVNLLHENKWGCLPVVENEQLVGIITIIDILRYTLSTLATASGESDSITLTLDT